MKTLRKALFLDRDGVLNRMVYDETHGIMDSPRRPEQLQIMPGARELLATGRRLGLLCVIVTNQPGIAKGTLTFAELDALHDELAKQLGDGTSVPWDGCYVCPNHPEGGATDERRQYAIACECRKPKPGMLLRASAELGIDLQKSWMVGDGIVDVQAGRAAGCRTVLVSKLKPELLERLLETGGGPDFYAADLGEVVQLLEQEARP